MTKKGLEKLEDLISRSEDIMYRANCLKRDIRNFYTIEEDVEDIGAHEMLTNAFWAMEEVAFRAECTIYEMQEAYKSEKDMMDFSNVNNSGEKEVEKSNEE
jgi:hypothetical protein